MNTLCATGHLGQDSEVRFTQSGKALTNFSLAIKSGWGDREKTTWLDCTLWGRSSDPHPLTAYLHKGTHVAVTGEITLEEWTANDGRKGKTLKCDVRNVTLLSKREGNAHAEKASGDGYESYPEAGGAHGGKGADW